MSSQPPHIPQDHNQTASNRVIRKPFVPFIPEQEQPEAGLPQKIQQMGLSLVPILGVLGIYAFYLESPGMPFNGGQWLERGLFSWEIFKQHISVALSVFFLLVLLLRYFFILITATWSVLYDIILTYFDRDTTPFEPPVTIIVPAYNEGKLIKQTLESLLALDYPAFEIIVVDDGSTDQTAKVVEKWLGKHGNAVVKMVQKPNGGKASALNTGIQMATHDFVLCVDGDSQLDAQTLKKAVPHLRDPKIGAVAGNVKVLNRNNLWTMLQALEYVEGLNLARASQSFFRLVNIIPGPVGLFRKTALHEVGWYNSDTFAEDCDITLKLLRKGWKVIYEPAAIAHTEAPNKLLPLLKQRYRWTRGILQALSKNRKYEWKNGGAKAFMWLLAFESLFLPFLNLFSTLYFVYAALFYGFIYYLVAWWLLLVILDFAIALYAISAEKEEVRLLPYTLLYRIFFVLIVDVCKVFATLEEFLNLRMSWGKLERIGNVKSEGA